MRPQRAFFGEKDFQQLVIVRGVVRDLALGVEIAGVPTVRADDGLALSSRNRFLTADERTRATSLYAGLREAGRLYAGGERDAERLLRRRARTPSRSSPTTSSCAGATTSAPTTRPTPQSCSSQPSSARRA